MESARYFPFQGEFILFMLNTGIRLGEAVALQYIDVDFDKGEISITKNAINPKERDEDGNSTGKRVHELSSTKTRTSKATIAISPFALGILREMKAKEKPDYNGFIVHPKFHKNYHIHSLQEWGDQGFRKWNAGVL